MTGATGFLGRRLVERLLADGGRVVVCSRYPERARRALGDAVEAHAWEPQERPPPEAAFRTLDGRTVEAVFHLAGDPIAEGRWTDEKKRQVMRSRQDGTRHLVSAIEQLGARPPVLVSSSAVGYYGDRGDQVLDETASPGGDFLALVCDAWEREAARAESHGLRVAMLRTGVVLGEGGGAVERMMTPFKLGLGGRLGDGRQWMPWVHVDDVVGLALHAATCADVRGPLNVVSPSPARNADFTRAFAAVLHRPAVLPVPAVALRLLFGELATVLLSSQRAVPRVAERTGYRFRWPELDGALRSALGVASQVTSSP